MFSEAKKNFETEVRKFARSNIIDRLEVAAIAYLDSYISQVTLLSIQMKNKIDKMCPNNLIQFKYNIIKGVHYER
ncbi:MAG: hypothetical protein DRG11_07590 [Epsilonproteobacteria bacterium]|nr:MAG: hypothetical protein DRG11_07590 [Campylobacterota bacterium]